jgi:hypothetical protein
MVLSVSSLIAAKELDTACEVQSTKATVCLQEKYIDTLAKGASTPEYSF